MLQEFRYACGLIFAQKNIPGWKNMHMDGIFYEY